MNSYQVDRAKWQSLTIFEQMGNIYSEVGRSATAQKQGRYQAAQEAAVRAFDLFDATAEQLAGQRSHRLREVLRAREEFAANVAGEPRDLTSYFLPFALAARRNA